MTDYVSLAIASLTLASVLIGLGASLLKAQAQHNTLKGKVESIVTTLQSHEDTLSQIQSDVQTLKKVAAVA